MIYKKIKWAIQLSIILTITYSISFGQTIKIRPLAIGDTLPEITLKTFLKDSLKKSKMSDYFKNNRLLLIDLSATWCVPCVEAWPKLDSLKKVFKGQLEVLAVTQEKRAVVKRFFLLHPNLNKLDMEFITDNLTDKPVIIPYLFPAKMVPQVIWINAKGMVIASTGGERVTGSNIDKAIKNQAISLPIKKDVLDFQINKSTLFDTLALYQSIITHYQDGLPGGSSMRPSQSIDDVKLLNDILFTNLSVGQLYFEAAFHNSISFNNNERLIWDINDSLRIKYDYPFAKSKMNLKDASAWYAENGYCYELRMQNLRYAPGLYTQMINDLNTWFSLNGHFEKQMMPCWVLKSTNKNVIKTKAESPQVLYKSQTARVLKNQSMSKFMYFLNEYLISGQIVDETGIDFNIDIDLTGFHGTATTPEMMNDVFSKYDLHLEKGERMVEVFVISPSVGLKK